MSSKANCCAVVTPAVTTEQALPALASGNNKSKARNLERKLDTGIPQSFPKHTGKLSSNRPPF